MLIEDLKRGKYIYVCRWQLTNCPLIHIWFYLLVRGPFNHLKFVICRTPTGVCRINYLKSTHHKEIYGHFFQKLFTIFELFHNVQCEIYIVLHLRKHFDVKSQSHVWSKPLKKFNSPVVLRSEKSFSHRLSPIHSIFLISLGCTRDVHITAVRLSINLFSVYVLCLFNFAFDPHQCFHLFNNIQSERRFVLYGRVSACFDHFSRLPSVTHPKISPRSISRSICGRLRSAVN